MLPRRRALNGSLQASAARRRAAVAAALLLLAGWTSPAPDVVLYCTPALAATLRQIAARFTATSHVPVHLFVSPPDGLIGLVAHRARADLVVADAATIARMTSARLVRAQSVVPLGRDPYVLVASARAMLPPGVTTAALLATRPVALPDPTTAASFDGAAVLRAFAPPAGAVGVSDTPAVIAAARDDPALVGLVTRSEAFVPGVVIAAPVPVAPAAMQAGLVAGGQSGQAAALLGFIAGPSGTAALRAAGLETGS